MKEPVKIIREVITWLMMIHVFLFPYFKDENFSMNGAVMNLNEKGSSEAEKRLSMDG